MMKAKGLLIGLVCVLILSGCSKGKDEIKDAEVIAKKPPVSITSKETKDKIIPISLPDLTTEKGIREYLSGKWSCDAEYMGTIFCEMDIDLDLNVHILFYDGEAEESKGEYKGSIKLNRLYAGPDEAPDTIIFELKDEEYPDNEYFFLHRTVYGGKRVMSLFPREIEDSIFDKLAYIEEDYEYMIEEVMFEKQTEEATKILPRKDDYFYATFWGSEALDGGIMTDHIWIDDVWWTPPEEDDNATMYPSRMTLYESDIPESVLYKLDPDTEFHVLGDGGEKGEVYYVETDHNGNITEFINAEYKLYLEIEEYNEVSEEVEELIMAIIMDGFVEIEEYLEMGMSVLFTENKTMIDGEECYDISLGTNHEEHFVQEIHYSVNIYTGQIYRYDVIADKWEELGRG